MGLIPILFGAKYGKKHDIFGLNKKARISEAKLKWINVHNVYKHPEKIKLMEKKKLYRKYLNKKDW